MRREGIIVGRFRMKGLEGRFVIGRVVGEMVCFVGAL
jgi:hypothetical protein